MTDISDLYDNNQNLIDIAINKTIKKNPILFNIKRDLWQHAAIGLWEASKNYNEKKGKFSPFASKWIECEIIKNTLKDKEGIHIPAWIESKIRNLNINRDILIQSFGRTPTIKELEEKTGFSEEEIINFEEISKNIKYPKSLEEPESENGNISLKDTIPDPEQEEPFSNALSNRKKELMEIINTWPKLDQDIIKMKHGIEHGKKYSRREIAETLELHIDKVERIELKRERKLMNLMGLDF